MRVEELRRKEVINLYNGSYLGRVADVEIDLDSAGMTELVIYGRLRWFGLLGREDDVIIRWEDIEVIGEDSILVRFRDPRSRGRRPPSLPEPYIAKKH